MTAMYLDPEQMATTATAVSTHVREAEAAVDGLEGLGAAAVPPELAGWLAQELREVALVVRMSALLYAVAALDALQRADQLRTNQSLALAVAAPGATSTAFADTPLVGGFVLGTATLAPDPFTAPASAGGGFVLGQAELATYAPFPGQSPGFLLGLSGGPDVGNPRPLGVPLSGSLSGVFDAPGTQQNRLWTLSDERTGTTFISPGVYERDGKVGSWSSLPPTDEER